MGPRNSLRRWLPLLLLLVLIPLALLLAARGLTGRADREGLALAEQSVRRAAVECYALEGAYPENLDYLKERYGLAVDEVRYFVDYRYVASNLMPDITVLPRAEVGPVPTAAPQPPAPASSAPALRKATEITEDRLETTTYSDASGDRVLTVHVWDDLPLDDYWGELAAFLAPGGPDFDMDALAAMAQAHHTPGGLGWSLALGREEPFPNLPFRAECGFLNLSRGEDDPVLTWRHAALTGADGAPMSFADLFTAPEDEAARRVLEALQAQNGDDPDPVDAAALAAAFDRERVFPAYSGLLCWYPPGALRGREAGAAFTIPYSDLGDILIPLSDAPVWQPDGFEVYYLCPPDGALLHYDALGDYSSAIGLLNPGPTLIYARYFFSSMPANAYQSPGWTAVDGFYRAEQAALADSAARRAEELAPECRAEGKGWMSTQSDELGQYLSWQSGNLACFRQRMELSYALDGSHNRYAALSSGEAFDLGTGARLAFRDLFTDPDEAQRRTAQYLAGQTGLTPQEAAEHLITPYGFCLDEAGQIVILRPASRPDTYAQARMRELEAVGVHPVHEAQEYPLPAQLLADLRKP